MSNNDNNNNNDNDKQQEEQQPSSQRTVFKQLSEQEENDLMIMYVRDVGFKIFTYMSDLLTETVTEEKPLSPYVACAMISNLAINFINEFTSYEKEEKKRDSIKKVMYNGLLRLLFFENNKEVAQAIMDNPDQALDMLKQKYMNMLPIPQSSLTPFKDSDLPVKEESKEEESK